MKIPDEINEAIKITYQVLKRVHPDININDDSTLWGYCYEASSILSNALYKLSGISGTIVHGEIAHNPRCKSQYWDYEHTWVEYKGWTIDITCGQFRHIILNIPSVYIKHGKHKWFLLDKNNFYLKHRYDWVYNIEYNLMGKISDKLRGGK